MKKSIPLILILLHPLFALSNGFIVKGSVDGLQTGAVSLDYINETGEDTNITAAIVSGKFILTGTVPEPEAARLNITGEWAYSNTFFLENADINIHLVKDAPENTLITGSASNKVYEKLKPGLNTFFANARRNDEAHKQSGMSRNSPALKNADSLLTVQQKQWMETIHDAIAENPKNYAALYFIQWLLYKPDDFYGIMSLFVQLDPIVRNGFAGKKFTSDFEHLYLTAPGQPAPEITGKDTSGHTVTLASFKGKVVLLDFWSSYCGPCRQENRRMPAVYQKYHPAGFEIISFSLDNERPLWLKAIQADQLTWPQATDLRGGAGATANTYNITDLPRNVLIDRTGKIIAKDLHGQDLIEAVEEGLGKGK